MRRYLSAMALALIAASNPPDTKTVQAVAETTPVGTVEDAADDPAIWLNTANPAASLIVATDKRAGLHLYDLQGKALNFIPSPRLNNVDLRDGIVINGEPSILVVASDRQDVSNAKMALFKLNTQTKALMPLASIPVGPGEAYGMCLWQRKRDKALFGFLVLKDGRIDQVAFDFTGSTPVAPVVRSLKLGTQSEGCVADDRTGKLYVAEEDVGLWQFDAKPNGKTQPVSIAKADGQRLVIDAEGLALAPRGKNGGYLIVSSQGDNAYAVYRLPHVKYVGRFKIGDAAIDGAQETDGIDLVKGDFGPRYPMGLFVAQDGVNAPDTQNFKFVSWADVVRALRLK
jgi:3-phytase